jgi:hypothetical protein
MFELEDDIMLLVMGFISLFRCEDEWWDNAYGFLVGAQDDTWWQSEIETKITPIELCVDSKHK